jgi:CheY-like chemotaxis protein
MAAKKILVCDDDPAILKLLRVNLEIEGYDVLEAHHGEEAYEIAQAELPNLIILDIMMPRWDGYEACRHLKADETTKHIPVVFVSAKAQQSDIDFGRSLGVEEYLTKPFDPNDLVDLAERLTAGE